MEKSETSTEKDKDVKYMLMMLDVILLLISSFRILVSEPRFRSPTD